MFGKSATLILAWTVLGCGICLGQGGGISEVTAAMPAPAPARASHYVEFRVAQIGAYGHSYAAYGRMDAKGEPSEFNYADLHPTGNYLLMAVGHVLPVPANTEWNPDVLKLPVASSYRRKLTADQYRRLLAAVRRARAVRQPYWNGLTNNCNHFVGELARSVGLRVPSGLLVSYAFVPALRDLNEAEGTKRRAAR